MAALSVVSPIGFLLLLLLQVCTWYTAVSEFSVKGPTQPVRVLLGADASLPCQLVPEQNAAHMHILWYRNQPSQVVLMYKNRQEQGGEQMLEYRGRTELVGTSIDKGDASLLIQQVRSSDDGQYQCQFKDGSQSGEVTVQLQVIGLGSNPQVHMTGPTESGIRVLCSSGGWFPKPSVQWMTKAGAKLETFSESHTEDKDGLFQVESSVIVTDSSLNNVTCSIQNPLSSQKRASAIFLPEPFFPRMCPWKAATLGIVPVLLFFLSGVSFVGWRKHQAKEGAIKKRQTEFAEREKMKKEKEEALQKRGKLKEEYDRRKALYDADWKKALIYPDWRKEHFTCVSLTVNREAKDADKKGTLEPALNNKQDDSNLITLNQEAITSGRFYWEVDVQNTEEWTLGVYEEPIKRRGETEASEKTFRILERKGDKYRVLAYCLKDISHEECAEVQVCPQKIVVFLDYEDKDISFYNMTDGNHIYSFTKVTFKGQLSPYFKLRSTDLSKNAK
ncbi:PREDICTED: butyrophilin-like protein 1 [Condylura cristata]|uniref:butyrophilin-like protein 1 n=1 Tax=Condylura cristata TaxID=143302 RepID=UPI000642B53B|nr:PREDICTED: butyrophilin-like protein 1 [Condylura cristata]